MDDVEIGLLTRASLARRDAGRRFLELLFTSAPKFSPDKYNNFEPINRPFDHEKLDEALEAWGDDFLWKRRRPKTLGQVLAGGPMVHDSMYLSVAAREFDVAALVRLGVCVSLRVARGFRLLPADC